MRARGVAGAWALLAVCALAASTVCALLLLLGRAPLPAALAASLPGFRSALVLHVSLAVVAWFLCCAAAVWSMAARAPAPRWAWGGPLLAGAGMAAMLAALGGKGAPVLANYVPVLASPLFVGGLLALAGGVLVAAAWAAPQLLRRRRLAPWQAGALWSMLAASLAAGTLLAGLAQLGPAHDTPGYEALAWAPGHLLQFVHILLLMSLWSVLGKGLVGRRTVLALLALGALPLLGVPLIYWSDPVGSPEFRLGFTELMRWASWPAPAALALRLLWSLLRGGRAALRAQLPLLLSLLLFLLGCLLGTLIRGESTMVPAHYHGTVGAVTLAYMALGYRLLPRGAPLAPWRARWQAALYGAGLLTLAGALAWSGALGVPRKTVHAEVLVQHPAYAVAMGLAGVGGLLAVAGAAWFVLNVGSALGAARRRRVAAPLLGGAGASVLAGVLLALWPVPPPTPAQVLASRFEAAVQLLNHRQYEPAAAAWHKVLALAPRLPEAHVNMGFTMIGLQRYPMARDFFASAIELNSGQTNAYFGLALAQDALGDRPGALGAMRSYVHLARADDPFRRRANAAIWEWETERAAQITEIGNQLAGAPNPGKVRH